MKDLYEVELKSKIFVETKNWVLGKMLMKARKKLVAWSIRKNELTNELIIFVSNGILENVVLTI